MDLEKILKNLIFFNIFSFVALIIFAFYESDDLIAINENIDGGILFSENFNEIFALLLISAYVIIYLIALYKIYKLNKFGKDLYLGCFIAGSLLTLLSGSYAYGPIVMFFTELNMVSIGAILALIYFSPIKKRFK